jgi:glycosyltransferase involved in cell wall biosynthesis|tara:strand:+ start:26198 stop:27037 length:840 start_codon:yes stop_codon:yes gene_type:complete
MISVITINYNDASGLEETIQSVLSQENADYEFIVIDGGSTDNSTAVIEKYKQQLHYWVSEPDGGVYNAMNKGIVKASKNYVYFLNSGDTLYDNSVLAEVQVAMRMNHDIYYGNIIQDYPSGPIHRTTPRELSFSFFFKRTIPHQASFIKRELFEHFGLYNEELKIVADWEFFVLSICKHNVSYQYLDRTISVYDTKGLSSMAANKALFSAEKQTSLKTHFPLFYNDYVTLTNYEGYFGLNRFQMLKNLENSRIAQRMNTVWLNILSNFWSFNEKDKVQQ